MDKVILVVGQLVGEQDGGEPNGKWMDGQWMASNTKAFPDLPVYNHFPTNFFRFDYLIRQTTKRAKY